MSKYLAYWCNEGFESLTDISKFEKWEQEQLVQILASKQDRTEPNPLNPMIQSMILRARFNPQREYELYAFAATDSVDPVAINEWMDRDPQSFVDWIRENGVKIHSDRNTVAKRIIS